MKKFLNKKFLIIVSIALIIGTLVATSLYFYFRARDLEKRPLGEKQMEQMKEIVAAVSKLIALPVDELPTLVTVTDPEKLKGQPFFVRSSVGDKVLLYQNAKKAILYRPSEKKIIDVSSLTINEMSTQSGTQTQEIRVVLFNGTTITGLTKKFEPVLKSAIPTAVIVGRNNASSSTYKTSLLIDVMGTREMEAKEFAQKLGMATGVLPDGEDKPTSTDFLIILGEDRK